MDSIYTALLQLMQTHPYQEIRIKDIVERAGVSRMAYYRNYETKDDILTNRLRATLAEFEYRLQNCKDLTEVEYWTTFFAAFQQDPVIVYMMRAGLVNQIMQAHKEFTIRIYAQLFHWDMSDPCNLMLTYQRMGSMIGLMLYAIEHDAVPEILAAQIAQLIAEDPHVQDASP